MSTLWDRAVESVVGLTGIQANTSNWASSALDSDDEGIGLHVRYLDSDPCFDLVRSLHSNSCRTAVLSNC